jgi:peptide/nickel transport system substrate-binding protein
VQTPSRTLVIGMHLEPTSIAPRPPNTAGGTPTAPTMIFSGWLVAADGHHVPRPQLAEKLPELNTSDWQVFPDGRMETTFRLKPGLTWHDGTPLTAEDVVFGWKVFTWPDMGVPMDPPIRLIQEVVAPDPRTVVIRWKQPYAEAALLDTTRYGAVPPMPRHLLEEKFRAGDVQAFLNDPYWTNGFVGSGPYRLDRWEPGSFIQGSAFDGFVDGRPQIEQVKLVFLPDPSSAVASLMAGDVHVAAEEAIGFEQGTVLKKQWESTGAGVVLLTPNKTRFLQVQFKGDYTNPRAVTDLRVRKALLQATDRAALSAAILDGQSAVADTIAGPVEEYFADLDRVESKYPYSLQQAERLLADAGYTKGADGVFVDGTGQRLSFELRAFAADPGPTEATILASQWKTFGLDPTIYVIPAAQSQNLDQVSAYPAFRIEQTGFTGTTHLLKLSGTALATAQNRWAGVNRGGWVNPEYDRYVDQYISSLDRAERNRGAIEALRIAADELPAIPLYYLSLASAYTSALKGMSGGYNNDTSFDNVYQWSWAR